MNKACIVIVGLGVLAACAKRAGDSSILPSAPAGAQAMTLAGRPLAAAAYGLGNWRLVNGDTAGAKLIFSRILEEPSGASFGYIAAEAAMTPDLRH